VPARRERLRCDTPDLQHRSHNPALRIGNGRACCGKNRNEGDTEIFHLESPILVDNIDRYAILRPKFGLNKTLRSGR
jgi:hypothetical protein